MTDIVYILGDGAAAIDDRPLRWSLRSLEKFATNVGRVVVCGRIPEWLSDEVVKVPSAETVRKRGKGWNILYGYRDAVEGAKAVVEVGAEADGAALHYYGGIVYPKQGKKALAIPVNPAVWDRKPSEFDPDRSRLSLAWPKGATAGTLRDKKTDEVYYLLVAKATMKADPTVLPDDNTIASAVLAEIEREQL